MTYTEFFDNAFTILESACEGYEYELTAESVLNEEGDAGEWIKNKIVSLAKIIKTVIVKIWKAISNLFKNMIKKLNFSLSYNKRFILKRAVRVPRGLMDGWVVKTDDDDCSALHLLNHCRNSISICMYNIRNNEKYFNGVRFDDDENLFGYNFIKRDIEKISEYRIYNVGTEFPLTIKKIKKRCEAQSNIIDEIMKQIEIYGTELMNVKNNKNINSDIINSVNKNISLLKDISNRIANYAQECSKIVQLIIEESRKDINFAISINESIDFDSMDIEDMNRYRASLLIEAADLLADK